MKLAGLQKVTLLDYPGEVACTVFTQGCNLRCPFCQNPDLVLPELFEMGGSLSEEDFFDFLERRRGKLSAVAVSGGEPTLHADLPEFLGKIRKMGYLVKIDTNGLNPEALSKIIDLSLADYVAMDVKNSSGKYALTCGIAKQASGTAESGLWERARESIAILKESTVPCEFRTTVALGLHTVDDIREMAGYLAGPRPWFLQQFVDSGLTVGAVLHSGLTLASPSLADLEEMRKAAADLVPNVEIRGV